MGSGVLMFDRLRTKLAAVLVVLAAGGYITGRTVYDADDQAVGQITAEDVADFRALAAAHPDIAVAVKRVLADDTITSDCYRQPDGKICARGLSYGPGLGGAVIADASVPGGETITPVECTPEAQAEPIPCIGKSAGWAEFVRTATKRELLTAIRDRLQRGGD